MFKNDNFFYGLLFGLVFPAFSFLATEVFKLEALFVQKENVWYMISVVLNLILMRYFFKQDQPKTASGVIFITFFSALALVFILG